MGNRVKGKTKQKSIKAAFHSKVGSKRKLSRMGKKQKRHHGGLDATFLGRAACLKKLQVTLKDFRRLCILKGIYPREPKRAPKKKQDQVYYHIKDISAIAHEPLLEQFRNFKAFMKKVRKAANRNEKDEAARKQSLHTPTYTLHHLVRERYPRFIDALEQDMDDALTLIHLFAALPSEGRIQSRVTQKAQYLSSMWSTYCIVTSNITKSFISIKGIYMEANISTTGSGSDGGGVMVPIRWIVPHAFTQQMPKDVDYRVMMTFFEFYETLLGFVLYKLYHDIGVRYPLPTTTTTLLNNNNKNKESNMLMNHVQAVTMALRQSKEGGVVSRVIGESMELDQQKQEQEEKKKKEENEEMKDDSNKMIVVAKKKTKKTRALLQSIDVALHKINQDNDDGSEDNDEDDDDGGVDISEPFQEALQTIVHDEEKEKKSSSSPPLLLLNEESSKRKCLFQGLIFFFSREIPRGYLELICLSYGGKVGWEDDDNDDDYNKNKVSSSSSSLKESIVGPMNPMDSSITHYVIDRPKLPSSSSNYPKSREYIQPQWIIDSANHLFLLPCSRYGIGMILPPHLSPWVNDEEEGYKPAYAEEIEQLKSGELLPEDIVVSSSNRSVAVVGSGSGSENTSLVKKDDQKNETNDDDDVMEEKEENDRDEKEEEEEADNDNEKEEDEDDDGDDNEVEEEEEEEEEEDAVKEEKARKRKLAQEEEDKLLARTMMNKKAKRLYGRMQHGIAKKHAKADELYRRRNEIESTKEKNDSGQSLWKRKMNRLKQQRQSIEKEYSSIVKKKKSK